MNIEQAKQEVKRTIRAYLSKDEFGEYRVETVRSLNLSFTHS